MKIKTLRRSEAFAYALLRVAMGIDVMCHGLVRLSKIHEFRDWMTKEFSSTILPSFLVFSWASVLPFIEFIVGFLILIGLYTLTATIAGAIVICILLLGSCLHEQWEWAGIQLVYALIYYILIGRASNNYYSIDGLIEKRKAKKTLDIF